jgi:hypothetical protein
MVKYFLQPGLWGLIIGTASLIALVAAVARRLGWSRPILRSVAISVGVLLVAAMLSGVASRGDAMATDGAGRVVEIVATTGALFVYVGPIAGVLKALEWENAWFRAVVMVVIGHISLWLGILVFYPIAGGLALLYVPK